MPEKKFTILAGPNGAGKTTFVTSIFQDLFQSHKFLNADFFAHDMNPEDVRKVAITAGKKFLNSVDAMLQEDHSFVIETTLSGKNLLKKVQRAKAQGFTVRLVFLWVSSAELCDFRVKGRVASGGHNIPIEDILRRYTRGLSNLSLFLEHVDEYEIYLSSETPQLIVRKSLNSSEEIIDQQLHCELIQAMKQAESSGL